ncbi:ZmpA/ZmpB/ZmpC family metallo-endopeptidase [Abiotrophia defectiva]|uniref:ZmpA/ZmpB/ZmpC family metallo-endopeptidase n=2 Tax=Abiotrophia defectiva TaxID=46125 RepID=UPI002281EA37|nr:ZmpA/ZmpB/ZmpC family metallo-endopeptidase [Abiotrophia defectiva]
MKFKGKLQRPNQIQRFSIRKFSVGIASVVIGSFFMGTIAPISVQAQESISSQYVASAPTLSSITTSYQYVALQELTPAQQQAILSGTPSDIAQADQVYYFVYRPIESKQVLPATGEAAPLFGAMAGALTLIVAVGLIRDRKKTIMTLMVVSSLGQILSTSATLALESRLLNRYNQVFYSQQGDQLPDPRIHIEGYEYVGYFAQATLRQTNNTLPQSSESSSQVQSNEEVSSEEPSSQVASESSSSSPANAVVTSSVASSESSVSTSDLSSNDAESSSEAQLSSESEASLSQSSEVTVSESSSQSSESSQPVESTQSSDQPVSSEPAESESSQAVISQPAESSSQVESTPQLSSEASSQNQTPNPAESSSEAPSPTPAPTPQPEPPKPLNYAAWQANLEQAQAGWQVLTNDDLSGKTPKSVKAYNDALAILKQDYQALVEAMTSLQASGAVSQSEIDQLTSKMTGIIARQVALPDTLVKRADQTPLITQSDNLANLVKTLNATDLSQKTPASVQALKEQIKFAQAALQNGGSVLKDGDATEADITAMAQNLANQLKSLQDAQAALQDRADLSALKEALNQLAKPINTDGKTPKSVKQFEAAKAAYAERLAELIAQANAVQEDPNASQEQVDTVVAKVQAFQREVNQAQELLVDQTDKKVLTQSKADLDQLLASEPDLSNKTPKSVAAYRQAKEVAQRLTQEAAQLLANLDASPMEVLELNEQLNQAQEKLRTAETAIMAVADKESLRQAKQGLAKKPDTTGKTPKSVAAYQAQVQALARELAQVNDQAQAVLDDANASPAEVEAALAQVQAQQEKLDQAAKLLKDQANKTALEQAIRALETDLAQEVEGSNKTPFSLALFRQKQEEAREALKQANRIVQDLDASPDEVATAEERVNQSKAALKHAKENLRDQAGKATLHKLLEEMVKPVSTEGKTPKSIQEYQTEYGRHRAEIDAALAKGAQVAEDKNATEDAVQEAISALEQALERKSNSQLLLVNQVDKTALRAARQELQDLLSQKPDLNDKTPASIRDYQEVLEEAETELDLLSSLIEDPNTAEDEMNDALAQSQTTMASLESAIAALTPKADKVALEQALSQINQPIDLVGKTPNSVTAFEEAKQANQASRDQAIQKAQDAILDENATPEAVSQALTELKAAQAKLDQARAKLVNQSDKSALKQARAALDTILQAQADLTNKTPQSVGAYERARQAAQAQVQDAQAIIADANATPNAVAEAVNKIKEAQANLKAAQEGLTNQADKAKLIQAFATLKQPISTEGKTPKSIQAFNQAQNDQLAQVEAAKNEAERIIANQDASPEQVSQALQAIQEAQSQINQAKALLVNQADKSALEQAKQNLDTAIQATPNLTNKTPQSVQAYEQAKANAQAAVQAGQAVIADLNASPESVEAAKTRITQAQAALKTAQDNLRDKANKAGLQSALTALNAPISTAGKTPRSIDAFRVQETGYQADLNSAKQAAQAVLADENATASQVAQALEQVQAIQARVNAAKALLVEQADKSALTSERTKLQNEVDQAPDLANKTPQSIAAYEAAKAQADAALAKALSVQNDLNATPAQVQEAIKQLQASHTVLTAAKSGLQTKADKQALIAALNKLNAPIATNGKTPNSIRAFEQAQATDNATTDQAKAKAQAVIADENATEAQVAQALQAVRDAQTKVDVAKALLVNQADKSALEQAKQNLDTAIQATPNLANKTPQSVQAYEQAKSDAQAAVQAGQAVIADLNASPEAVEAAKARITQAQAALKAAQDNLQDKANKAGLQSALNALNAPISTAGKTPNSIRAFEQAQAADKATTDQAKAKAQAVIADENATEAQVAQALQAVREAQTKVDIAKAFLVNQADKSALEQAKQNLDTALQTTPSLANKTPQSVQVYEQAKADAQAAVQAGQAIIADLNASPEAVEAAKARISQAQADLEAAKNNLRDKADKSSLVQALATLNQTVSTTNKTPNSIQAYQARLKAQDGVISPAKSKAAQVIADENASREQVEDALRAVQAAQTQVNQAAGLLVNQADKHLLSEAINNSQAELNQAPTLADKTPKSVSAYEQAKVTAQAALGAAKDVQSDPNATQAQVQDAINRLASTKKALEKAKSALQVKGDKAGLRAAYEALNSPISTVGKTPRSIDAFRTQESGYQSELDAAKQAAQSVLADENATASQVAQALEQVQAIQAKVNAAKTLLVDQADKSALTSERTKLQNEVDQAPDLANKTPQSIATYESAKAQADAALAKALSVQNDLNATPAQVQEAVNQLKASHTALTSAKAGLQTKADKQALITALNKLNEPIATDGKTPASITAYRNSLTANQSTINQAKAQAQAMIANENASQVQVNEALQAIKSAQVKIDEAKNKLVDQANKQALQASIAEAGPLVENHYTPASWQALQTQLSAAKQVNQDPNASQSAVDSAKQALDQAIAQLVMHTPRFTSQEVVLPTDELSRSVTVNYTLFDPANKYQSAQVKVYQGDQLVQTVAINNNQAVINSLNYEVPYRLVTELTYADKSGVSKTDPQLSEERVELKLKKFELKQIKEEGLYQVEGQELKRVSALASVPQDLSGYLVKVSSDRYKDVVLKVVAIEATTYNGEDYYQVTATAPELVQNNGGTTDYHQTHQFLVRKAAPAVNNVYHSFGELLTAMKANLSGTFILGSNVSAADVVLAKGQEAYLMDTFRGKLLGRGADGQAHAIFDLKAPLFKETNQATISNLDLKRVDIRDRDNVGSLAVVANQTTITDVTASGRLSGSQSIGGLVATVLGGSQLSQVGFKGSIESMAFNGANSTIGGIVANLEKGSITQATADINMHLSSGNENSRYGGLVGAVGSGSSLTKAVVKGNIWNSGSGVLRRWGSSTGGAVGSTWSNSRIDQVISETKVDNGRIFFGHRNAEQQESTRRSFSNIAVVQDVASGIEQEFLKSIETISPQEAANRQQAMGITVSFDDSSDAVTTLSKESLMTDYTAMPNYKADKAQAYANMEKLLPFYNKEQIIKYGNLATGKLASQVLVSVTPMMGSNYVTDYSQPMDRIMLHYADKSVQYLGLAAKSNFKQTGIVEYQLEDSGLIYTPNQIQQASIESLAQDLAAQLSATDLYSDKMFELLGIKTKNYVNDKVKQTRKDALQKTLGRVPTDEELQADLDAVNQAERIKDVKRLYLEDTLARLKPNLTDAVKKVLKQSLNLAIDGGHSGLEAQLKQQVLDNKEALLLGLLYMHRHYEIKFGEANIGEIATYQADFFGKSENVLDKLIYLGSRGINALHTKNNFRAYAAFISPNQAVGNLLDYLDYFRETLTDLDENAWFRQATQQNLVLEERASREAGLANKEYRIYPRLKARSVQNYILPLLNLKDSTLFAISTVNGFTWGSLDRRSYDRQRLEELVNLMANRQQTHLDTWYRMALPAVKDRIANNPGNQTWDGYKDATGQWFGEFGESNAKGNAPKNPSMGIREFFGPIGRYFGANGSAAYADTISNIYFIHTDMLNDYNGASIWTHELVHLQDRSINLGGYGWRPDERFEQYPQGLLQAPENPSTINHMGINTIFDYSNEKLRYYNESPDRFQTAADVHEYVHGVFDVLYTLDYAEGLDVLARGKDFWKKMYNQVTNEADGVHANNLIKGLTDQEWENINLTSINDLVEHQLVVKRGYGANAKYNRDNYVTINMYAPNYATGENTTGSPGGLMFKRMAWEMMAYKGYEDGFVPYASDKLQKEAKAAGNAELSDTYVIRSVSGGEFQNMTVFKQAMFKERIDKLNQSLIPITVNGTQVRTFADIQQLIHQAMEADIKANFLTRGDNNVHKVKKEIYRQYLLATNDFRTSIFQGQ